MATFRNGEGKARARGVVRSFALVACLILSACKPAQTVDFYRQNGEERDKMVNLCLSNGSTSWDCTNAITAEAERWGTKDIDGFTVVIGNTPPPPATPTP